MSKVKQQIKKAQKSGLTPLDVLRMREIAKKEANLMLDTAREEATEEAFIFMLAIPLNVLVNDYWPKSARKKAPKFIDDVISLYESVQEGVVTREELVKLLEDMAHVKVSEEWLKARGIKNES